MKAVWFLFIMAGAFLLAASYRYPAVTAAGQALVAAGCGLALRTLAAGQRIIRRAVRRRGRRA